MRSGRFIWITVVLLLISNAPCINAFEEELIIIPTRPKVTQPFLLIRPTDKPVASVILFAGDHGRLALSPQGIGWGSSNFLVRNRTDLPRRGFW
jgi:hypothetical protein